MKARLRPDENLAVERPVRLLATLRAEREIVVDAGLEG